jgi:hypothetical protein
MANVMEIRVWQKDKLYELLETKLEMERENIETRLIDRLINKNKASMEAEDVAYVEKMIAELK